MVDSPPMKEEERKRTKYVYVHVDHFYESLYRIYCFAVAFSLDTS